MRHTLAGEVTIGISLDLAAAGFARPAEPMAAAATAEAKTAAPNATQAEELAHRPF